MRPSNDNLQYLMDFVRAIGFTQTDVTLSHHEFEEPTVPAMSDRNTFFIKGSRTVKINEVFVGGSPSTSDSTRVAIILYVSEGPDRSDIRRIGSPEKSVEKAWMELFEIDQIVDYFKSEIRDMRIARILT
jgi:hypothetical protein